MKNILAEAYGYLFEDALIDEIVEVGALRQFCEDDYLIEIGESITQMPLLTKGVIKVMREDEDDNEFLLYFIEKGNTCAMTLTCCMGQFKSKIKAVAETDGMMVMVPVEKMEVWLIKFKTWRNFVLNSYNGRLMEMVDAIDTLAFMNMDERLYKYLMDKYKVINSLEITTTHQQIAYELHTSRVVISRLLKGLENKGKIKLHRNKIELLNL